MAKARKLQQEVESVLKKVAEGADEWTQLWLKLDELEVSTATFPPFCTSGCAPRPHWERTLSLLRTLGSPCLCAGPTRASVHPEASFRSTLSALCLAHPDTAA